MSVKPRQLADDSRHYLNVSIREKDSAKLLGARWDCVTSKFYVQLDDNTGKCVKTGNATSTFARWVPRIPEVSAAATAFTSSESLKSEQVAEQLPALSACSVESESSSDSDNSAKTRRNLN